jgi:predicted permease
LITSIFANAGNFGLPVTSFAFGETALAYATLFFVTNAVLTNTAGVVIISMGSTNFKKALSNLFKIPVLYALILAILVMSMGWRVPLPVDRTVKILGDASIPTLMVLIGVQFHSVKLKGKIIPLTLASVMRLLVSPTLALGLSAIFGLYGPARQAVVLEAAMPAAVLNTVLATQFDTEPTFVTEVVAVTTILSAFTLTPLLAYLGG